MLDKSTKSSENSNKILTEDRFKYPIEIDEKYFPTSLKELELLEKIVKNKEPNLFDILKLDNKREKELKLQRRKVTKILKILNSMEIVHPTLKSININNMIGQKAPFVTNKDKLLTIYNTSTTWTNWSNYNSLWAKVLNGVDISSCLEAFVIKEFFQNSVSENNMKTISSLIEHHATALVDDTLLDPFHPDYFANLFLQVTTTFGTSHLSHTQDAAFNKYLLLLSQDNVVKNKRRYQSIINKLESSILKQCLNCIQEIVFKNCVMLEKQIKLYIHYCFSGQYIPFLKRSNDMEETNDNKMHFQEQLIDKSKFFFESMLLKDSEFIIPDPEHICVVFHHDTQTYEGRYLPTNEKLDFVVNKQNGHFAEQLLALEIKNGGITARIEDTIKQKPYIIVERKSDLLNEKNVNDVDRSVKKGNSKNPVSKSFVTGTGHLSSKRKKLYHTNDDDDDDDDDEDNNRRKYFKQDLREMDFEIEGLRKKLLKYSDPVKAPKLVRPSTKTITGEGPVLFSLKNKKELGGGKHGQKPYFLKSGLEQYYQDSSKFRDPKVDNVHPDFSLSTESEKQEAILRHKTMVFHEKNISDLERELIKTQQKEDSSKNKTLQDFKKIKETRKLDLKSINDAIKKLQTSLKEKKMQRAIWVC